ncbi:hypothetical protein POVWA2_008860 [Plasmodium ovale wallikeri]|uniref:Uncharacterized protein n=1 Tax=Plasmodium ovale wallikeri TaxID=864142 RepID=A0A1A8YJS7_PLAOA|nr:hypothetical protein POVWA1_008870 [Plasmodium ovale wallikeri]SBT32294.1 hypothetical protein POVWA2_008860 [Plasmodium ovale wallikeri]
MSTYVMVLFRQSPRNYILLENRDLQFCTFNHFNRSNILIFNGEGSRFKAHNGDTLREGEKTCGGAQGRGSITMSVSC